MDLAYEAHGHATEAVSRGFYLDHGFSAGFDLLQGGLLAFRATTLLEESHGYSPVTGLRLDLQVRPGQALLRVSYAFTVPSEPEAPVAHHFSVWVHAGGQNDVLPPTVRAEYVPTQSAAGTSRRFRLEVTDNAGQPAHWRLTLKSLTPDGEEIATLRKYEGTGLPPRHLEWDGKDAAGNPAPQGWYGYSLWAEDASGNDAESEEGLLTWGETQKTEEEH
jgi:hypothetical protein